MSTSHRSAREARRTGDPGADQRRVGRRRDACRFGNTGGLFAGLPRMARAAMMGKGSTNVQFVTCVVNRANLEALAALLESGDVKVVIDKVYPLGEAADAVSHMLGHHARGKVVIAL